jgi:ribosome-binding ATPase YchF (GTP1/OBG family)
MSRPYATGPPGSHSLPLQAGDAGKLRLEGKEYTVQDGDVVEFRFNV